MNTMNHPDPATSVSRSAATGAKTGSCCEEFARTSGVSRRGFLGATALGAGAAATTAVFGDTFVTTNYAHAAEAGTRPDVLVVVSLRGAADGLSLVVPHGEAAYYAARPGIAVPKSKLLAADEMFGLHPSLAPLLPMWNAGTFGAVHATGLPARNRSHFSAMEELEEANPGSAVRSGWLNRLVGRDGPGDAIDAISFAGPVPPTLVIGANPSFAASSLDAAQISGPWSETAKARRNQALRDIWSGQQSPLADGVQEAFDTIGPLAQARALPQASYPGTTLARALRDTARTIKADVGAEAITVDTASWDHHSGMGTIDWGLQRARTNELAGALAAFFADLGPEASRVTVVTISEFGRRVQENDSGGTDHGYGNVMLLLGAGVRGGRVHGSWPGLRNEHDADLEVTTDYRHVLHEVITARFGSANGVFPGFTARHLGVMHA